jgi:predicted nucleic acid-binding protein
MIAFDTTFLTLMLIPSAQHEIEDARERVEFLISDIHGNGEKILIPTPALSEILIRSGNARNAIIQELTKAAKFVIAPFDLRSALELSLMSDAAISKADKKAGIKDTWAKVKFDRQIVSIAKTFGARIIYSEDHSLRATADREGLTAYGVCDIKMPKQDGFDWRQQ